VGDGGGKGFEDVGAQFLSVLKGDTLALHAGAEPIPVWKTRADAAMDRYAEGDRAAFAELYDALEPRLSVFFLRQVRGVERAKDLVQQTFLQMHQFRGRFVRGAAVSPWAFAIARNLLIDSRRRAKPEFSVPNEELTDAVSDGSTEASVADAAQARTDLDRLRQEIDQLSAEQRMLFELVHGGGLSYSEAASALGVTTNAVKIRMHRLTAVLREAVARRAGEK
jgi:RNA polymerase sigma-70 factor (ECF subfamily)